MREIIICFEFCVTENYCILKCGNFRIRLKVESYIIFFFLYFYLRDKSDGESFKENDNSVCGRFFLFFLKGRTRNEILPWFVILYKWLPIFFFIFLFSTFLLIYFLFYLEYLIYGIFFLFLRIKKCPRHEIYLHIKVMFFAL